MAKTIIWQISRYVLMFFQTYILISVTRLGDFLDFGQLFKALSNNEFAQISHILRHFL